MKIYNIITPKNYMSGESQKTVWIKAGTMRIIDNGECYIEWSAMPNITYKAVEKSRDSGDGESPQ